MYTLPLRLTILHLAQRFRTDGETFMTKLLTTYSSSQVFDYTRSCNFRLDTRTQKKQIKGQSGVEVLLQ
jgi:regulatory protein YycH of two-component signal transduction system YycFG